MTAHTQTTRRALIGGAGLVGVAMIAPALQAAAMATDRPTEFARLKARSDAARARFNTLPDDLEYTNETAFRHEEKLMHDATGDYDHAVPTNWSELVSAMENAIGDGTYPGREICDRLIGHARRLNGGVA
jgi:hypothetical protein